MGPDKSAGWLRRRFSQGENRFPAQNSLNNATAQSSADIWTVLVPIKQRIAGYDFLWVKIDKGEVGVLADGDLAFLTHSKAFGELFAGQIDNSLKRNRD